MTRVLYGLRMEGDPMTLEIWLYDCYLAWMPLGPLAVRLYDSMEQSQYFASQYSSTFGLLNTAVSTPAIFTVSDALIFPR